MRDYNDVSIEDTDKIEVVHKEIDKLSPSVGSNKTGVVADESVDDDQVIGISRRPDDFPTVLTKFRVKPDIPMAQREEFDQERAFHGVHAAYSNTMRSDNLRHLFALDLCRTYDMMPYLRQNSMGIKIRETSEFQICRSNQRVGGFEAELGLVHIQRQDATVHQFEAMNLPAQQKKKRLFGIFPVKEKKPPLYSYNTQPGGSNQYNERMY